MSTQASTAGKNYERQIRMSLIAKYGNIIPRTAGFGIGPDITIPSINNSGSPLLVEAKTSSKADFGQKSVTFANSSWVPTNRDDDNEAVSGLYNSLFNTYDIGNLIANAWNLPNKNITSEDLQNAVNNRQLSKVLYYEKLLQKASGKQNPFSTKTLVTGPRIVESMISYYNSRGVYYIQIKGSGFYIMGSDRNNLKQILGIDIPIFKPPTGELIIRGKASISNRTYSPTLTFKSSGLPSSPYSLDGNKGNFMNLLYSKF